MSVHRFNSMPQLIANLGPLETLLYNEFGEEDYMCLMEMYASVAEDNFDEWYDSHDSEFADYIVDLSYRANLITSKYAGKKMAH